MMIGCKRTLKTIGIILILVRSLCAQSLSREQKDILELHDSRSLGEGRLVSYLQNKQKDLRYRAVIALANIQDTSTVGDLIPLLQDEDVQLRAAAAFALGQIGSSRAEQSLLTALTPEQDIQVLPRVFEALGKCGDTDALNSVVSFIPSAKNIAVKRDLALSIARFAIRKITSERGVWLCFDLLKDNHSETRSAALYALWRCAPLGVIDVEISNRAYLLVKQMSDKEAEIRINLATLLGKTKSEEAPRLIKMFQQVESQSADWRVEVQLCRAAGSLSKTDPALVGLLVNYLGSRNDHVKITSEVTLAALDTTILTSSGYRDKIRVMLKNLATTSSISAPVVQGEALIAVARLFPDDLPTLTPLVSGKTAGNMLRAKFVEAESYVPTKENVQYCIGCLTSDSVRVAMSAWDVVTRMIQPEVLDAHHVEKSFVDSIPSLLVDQMDRGLGRNDMAITTLIATAFTDSSLLVMCNRAGLEGRIINALISAYAKLSSARDAEAMLAIQESFVRLRDAVAVPVLEQSFADSNRTVASGSANALTAITGKKYSALIRNPTPNVYSENDWKMLESIRNGQRVTFKTTKGTFTVRLDKENAHFTVLAFFKLVKHKFYNGLMFHRVVPDFVIQGGDPRGDGWGGPGFTIRSEWGMEDFERGSVGMASSGKDTEGCQFFITHIPTPHLDGRYTRFASVSTGMDVVDNIQVGDKILSVEIK
jgi:cyclophilin family peptidyl-prolyl cis-trans isomerase/HEAT repeat protein